MLRHIVSAVAALLFTSKASKGKIINTPLTAVQPDITPAFFVPSSTKGSFEGVFEARKKSRRAKIIRRNRSR